MNLHPYKSLFRENSYEWAMNAYSLKKLLSQSFAKELYKRKWWEVENLMTAPEKNQGTKNLLLVYFSSDLNLGGNIASQIVSRLKSTADIETVFRNITDLIR